MEVAAPPVAGRFFLHRVARRISLPRLAAKYAGARFEQRLCRLVDRLHSFWLLAYHQHGLSQLAVRSTGFDRGIFLWLDVAQDGLDLCFRAGACRGGRAVASPVPARVACSIWRLDTHLKY